MIQPFIVAEISGEHMGMKARARALVHAAAYAGADAVKFQTFTPEQMAPEGKIIEGGPWAGAELLELYRLTVTPREWHQELFAYARSKGLVAFSSVFHPDDVDFLETLDCPIYKISSFEVSDRKLIERASRTGKPVMISTGMATLAQIQSAVMHTFNPDSQKPTLLKCTSAYPASAEDANLATMVAMRQRFECDVGVSDHTLGIGVAVAATALGASVIEKHLTMDRKNGGPDSDFSLEPEEFKTMVTECRRAAAAIGTVHYGPTPGEAASLLLRRKSGGKRGD